VIIEHDLDCGAIYRHERRRLLEFARSLTPRQLETLVPATPAWRVLDVLAHVVAITADLNALRFGDENDDPDEWTARQVESRRGRSIDELEHEWEHESITFDVGLNQLGYEVGSHFVGDLLQHSIDVRSALGQARYEPDDALTAGLDFYVDSLHEALTADDIGALRLRWPGTDLVVGPGPPSASLSATAFDLFRSIGGRRSGRQIRALDWSGDVDRFVTRISRYGLPTADLSD
jgi:uncharacterized protein (TIGR03083 family)